MTTICVTGATGTIGSTLVPRLQRSGASVRALVRDRARTAMFGAGIEPVVGQHADPPSLRAALEGVDAVFLACGNVPEQVAYETAVIDAAAEVGVRRLVKLSARGAALEATVAYWRWHAQIERHLLASGIPAVVLQPGFYMTNLLAAADHVRTAGAVFAPVAGARIAMVHPADVAAVAAVALTDDDHEGSTYVLTGPEAIGYHQVAEELTVATGRPVGFVDVPPEAAVSAMVAAGLPAFAAEQVVAVFADARRGGQASGTDTVAAITGHPARPFAAFAREWAEAFGGPSSASSVA